MTASKAIIEKEYQPHVIVSTTGPNPFNTLTDRELEEYRREVERKHRGPPGERFCPPGLGLRAECSSVHASSRLTQASPRGSRSDSPGRALVQAPGGILPRPLTFCHLQRLWTRLESRKTVL